MRGDVFRVSIINVQSRFLETIQRLAVVGIFFNRQNDENDITSSIYILLELITEIARTMNTDAIVAGVLSGVISPFVVSWIQHKFIWRSQKQLEMKNSIFLDAVRALSQWSRDALDPALQAQPTAPGAAVRRLVEMRPETAELLERSKGLVQAFFAPTVYTAYDAALRAQIALDNIPNEDFEAKRTAAIVAMANELGIRDK